MRIRYDKTTWVDNETPVDACRLNKIENALEQLFTLAISPSQIEAGNGLTVKILDNGNIKFSVNSEPVLDILEAGPGIKIEKVEDDTIKISSDLSSGDYIDFDLDEETGRITISSRKQIEEYETTEDFPEIGESNILYIEKENDKLYYWKENEYKNLNENTSSIKIITEDVKYLSSDEVESLNVGDVIVEENSSIHFGDSRYLYTVVLKENNANGYRCCLVRFFESKMYVVYYVNYGGTNWQYNTTVEYDLANYIQKSLTVGLMKNDGTVDITRYGTYSKPRRGIPASDLESGVIPDISGKADKVSNATNGNFAGLDANGNLTDSGKKASDFNTPVETSLPESGGILPNVVYKLGTLANDASITIRLGAPTDNTIANVYIVTFDTGNWDSSEVVHQGPSVIWGLPIGTHWNNDDDKSPDIEPNTCYEVSIMDNIAGVITASKVRN